MDAARDDFADSIAPAAAVAGVGKIVDGEEEVVEAGECLKT